MRVVNEHECSYLKSQNVGEENVIAIQEMVQDTENGVKYLGWYWLFYKEKGADLALGIRCCPYCGEQLRED